MKQLPIIAILALAVGCAAPHYYLRDWGTGEVIGPVSLRQDEPLSLRFGSVCLSFESLSQQEIDIVDTLREVHIQNVNWIRLPLAGAMEKMSNFANPHTSNSITVASAPLRFVIDLSCEPWAETIGNRRQVDITRVSYKELRSFESTLLTDIFYDPYKLSIQAQDINLYDLIVLSSELIQLPFRIEGSTVIFSRNYRPERGRKPRIGTIGF